MSKNEKPYSHSNNGNDFNINETAFCPFLGAAVASLRCLLNKTKKKQEEDEIIGFYSVKQVTDLDLLDFREEKNYYNSDQFVQIGIILSIFV